MVAVNIIQQVITFINKYNWETNLVKYHFTQTNKFNGDPSRQFHHESYAANMGWNAHNNNLFVHLKNMKNISLLM